MTPEELNAAHDRSFRNKPVIEKSTICGCFFCRKTCAPSEIKEYVRACKTALCPNCGIDSLIGDASGLQVTSALFLTEMYKYWFEQRDDEGEETLPSALLESSFGTSAVRHMTALYAQGVRDGASVVLESLRNARIAVDSFEDLWRANPGRMLDDVLYVLEQRHLHGVLNIGPSPVQPNKKGVS
jgi:hypothetical protein